MAPRWTAPPNWPQPPRGWEPAAGWRPDPAWGPPPPGWVFYQDDDDRPGADGDLVCGQGTSRKAAKLASRLEPHLGEAEELRGLFLVNSLRPLLNILAVTSARLVLGTDDFHRRPPKLVLNPEDLVGFALPKGRMGVRLVRNDEHGQPTAITTLVHERDTEALAALVSDLRSRPIPPGPPRGSRAGTPAPSAEGPRDRKASREDRVADIERRGSELLRRAAGRAAEQDVQGEEQLIYRALQLRSEGPVFARGALKKSLQAQVDELIQAGQLRRRARLIGTVHQLNPVGFGSMPPLMVYDDRIILADACQLFDGDVSASVECDGQVLVHHRPTMTRMAAGAVLPGSALLVGMATAKKETTDTRSARFIIVHPEWRFSIAISPDALGEPRALAAQINKIADSKRDSGGGADDKLSKLERLAALVASGALSASEAERLRGEILRS